jgi:hypothetical protein
VTIPPPQFTGGQCPGVVYNASAVRIRNNGFGPPSGPPCELFNDGRISVARGLIGPVSNLQTRGITINPGAIPSTEWFIVHAGGEAPLGAFFDGCPGAGFFDLELVRADGLPDDCGDPGPDLPPTPSPINIDVDVTYGPSNEFNLTVPVVFGIAYVSIDGRLTIPVNIELRPDFNVSGTLELFPDFDLNLNFPVDGPPTDTGPGDDAPPENPPDDDGETTEPETPDEEPGDRPIYAVLLASAIEPETRASGIFQEVGPDIYAPRLGSVRFGTTLAGRIFWSSDIDIKGLREVITCPFPWGASSVAINPVKGVATNWVPVFTERPEWPPFLELGSQETEDRR